VREFDDAEGPDGAKSHASFFLFDLLLREVRFRAAPLIDLEGWYSDSA